MGDRAPSPISSSPTTQQKLEAAEKVKVKVEEVLALPSPTVSPAQTEPRTEPSAGSPSYSPTKLIRRTETQRRVFLQSDPQAVEVEPQRVLCRYCKKWIRLSSFSAYSAANWLCHKDRCSKVSPVVARRRGEFRPGSRVAIAARRVVLLNDPQVRGCSPRRVHCGNCKLMVDLEGEADYTLTKWAEHKEKCVPMTPAPITPQALTSGRPCMPPPSSTSSKHSHVSESRSQRSSTPVGEATSSISTETTAVAESSSPAIKVGVKRGREEESEEVAEERPTNRQRTETHKPPEKEAPASVFGWFMHPLQEFSRGFREGLGST